jgi:uroporphyrinogen III methyltransferase/synthase
VTGSLENIADKVKKHKLGSPAVIVVGEVVKLRKTLRWFDKLPLFGKRILVTRSRHQASALSKLLTGLGAEAVELPVIDIQPVADTKDIDRAILDISRYQWLVFTSSNGVDAFFARLLSLKLDSRHLHSARIAVIGPATAEALRQQGITPDYSPSVYTAAGLLEGFAAMEIKGKNFLLPRADIADKELSCGLRRLGGR